MQDATIFERPPIPANLQTVIGDVKPVYGHLVCVFEQAFFELQRVKAVLKDQQVISVHH